MSQDKQDFIKLFFSKMGILTQVFEAEECKITRFQFNEWMMKDTEFADEINSISERRLDFAENSLFKQIQEGNANATVAYLKMLGKNRGYADKPQPKDQKERRVLNAKGKTK